MGTTAVVAYFAGEQLYLQMSVTPGHICIIEVIFTNSQLTIALFKRNLLWPLCGSINYDREAAKLDPKHNVITRTVGFEENVNVDTFEYQVSKNDLFLLCSDGYVEK